MGMAQLTPYAGHHFQLHGMTKQITLYDDGLVRSTAASAQPELPQHFAKKLGTAQSDVAVSRASRWEENEKQTRTLNAIAYVGKFLPKFGDEASMVFVDSERAECRDDVVIAPFCGAQQIPGSDANLRTVTGVSFLGDSEMVRNYCRAEIVKASSALCCAENVVAVLTSELLSEEEVLAFDGALQTAGRRHGRVLTATEDGTVGVLTGITTEAVVQRAKQICKMRGFPSCLAEQYR